MPPASERQADLARRRPWASIRPWLVPVVALLTVTLPHLSAGDWQRTDSAWYAAISLQAWREGSLLTLFGEPGQPYFNKPPLVFWIQGLFMQALGANAWGARLPTILAAAGCVLVTVALARQGLNRRASMLSGFVLALSYEFFRRTREISLDMWQALFLLLGAYLAMRAIRSGKGMPLLLAGIPIGLALMCKQLVGLAAIPILGVGLLACGRWRLLPWLGATLALALAVAAPWHLAMIQLHGDEFMRQYFGAEVASRAAGEEGITGAGLGRWWFYLKQLAEGYWPWLLPLGATFFSLARRRPIGGDRRTLLVALVWSLLWLTLLSLFADRRDRYAIVLYPGLAILAGAWLGYRARPGVRRVLGVLTGRRWWLIPACGIGFAILPIKVQRPIDPQWVALFEHLESTGNPEVWQGSMQPIRGARFYIETGRWPVTTRNRWGERVATPPGGSLIVYHRGDGLAPGPAEAVLFQRGELALTRLDDNATWNPLPAAPPDQSKGP